MAAAVCPASASAARPAAIPARYASRSAASRATSLAVEPTGTPAAEPRSASEPAICGRGCVMSGSGVDPIPWRHATHSSRTAGPSRRRPHLSAASGAPANRSGSPTSTSTASIGRGDLERFGWNQYLSPVDGVNVVEWPERAGSWLPEEYPLVRLEPAGPDRRRIEIEAVPSTARLSAIPSSLLTADAGRTPMPVGREPDV